MNVNKIEKIITVLIVIIVFVSLFVYSISKVINDYKLNNMLSYDNYKTMIEFEINDGADFAIVIDKNNKVLTHFYFNEESVMIDDKNIDSINYKKSISNIFDKLSKKNIINNTITITSYDNDSLNEKVEKIVNKELSQYDLNIELNFKTSKLKSKAKSLEIEADTRKKTLILFNLYSHSIIDDAKEKESSNKRISYKEYKKYADLVYDKLIQYQLSNNINNQDINNRDFPIDRIYISDDKSVNMDSWYYINNCKVYAYIKFINKDKIYDFCYNGSKEEYKEGVCQNEE